VSQNELLMMLKAISFIDGRVRYINGFKQDDELYRQIDFLCGTILLHLEDTKSYYEEDEDV
jgi:hypothetical protein